MPMVDQIRIYAHGDKETLDRRVKLTHADKAEIKRQFFDPNKKPSVTMKGIAAKYGVHPRTIEFILYPDREQRHKENAKLRHSTGRYYDKDKSRTSRQKHRNYKRELLTKGELTVT